MSTSNIAAALPLYSSDVPLVPYGSGKDYSEVSCNALPRRSGVCSSPFSQEIPGRPNTPSSAKNVPDPNKWPSAVLSSSLSHGCQSRLSHRASPYSGYPTRSVTYDPLSRSLAPQQVGSDTIPPFVDRCRMCNQRQCVLASLSPYSSWEDEFPINDLQDNFPPPHLVREACLFTSPSLAQGIGFFHEPVSGDPDTVPIPEGGQISVSPGDAPVADVFRGPLEEEQPLAVWMRTPTNTAIPFDKNRYPVHNAGIVVEPYCFHDAGSNPEAFSGSRCAPPPELAAQPCFGQGQAIFPLSLSSLSQCRSAISTERYEKKTWCPVCEIDFSQPQVLGRHTKDKHETKESCYFCTSFKWSRGRPYLYRNHLRTRHPQITLPEFRQKGSKTPKEKLEASGLRHRVLPVD